MKRTKKAVLNGMKLPEGSQYFTRDADVWCAFSAYSGYLYGDAYGRMHVLGFWPLLCDLGRGLRRQESHLLFAYRKED